MKKKLLFVTVAALALASCSSDETVAVNQDNAINFRAYQTGLTRAADASLSGSSFKVTAFPTGTTTTAYFSDEFSNLSGTTFTSTNKYYWQGATNKLDFYAWAPATYSATSSGYTGFAITPGATIGSQPDFIYAVSKGWCKDGDGGAKIGSNGVALNFRHAESKVIINLKNSNANLKITVGDVTIGNILDSGIFSWNQCTDGTNTADNTDVQNSKYLDGNWDISSASPTSYTVTMESAGSYNIFDGNVSAKGLTSTTPADYEMILIPHALAVTTGYATASSGSAFNGAYISVELMIENKQDPGNYLAGDGTSYVTAMWPLTSITWLPGHKYTYIVDLAGGGYYPTNHDSDIDLDPIIDAGSEIKFLMPTVDTWTDAGNQNISN